MFDFFRNRCGAIAMDLGGDSVKMLQLKRDGAGASVAASAKWRVPAALRSDPVQRRSATVAAVREMLRRGGFRGRNVCSSLSCCDLAIKNVRLPSLNPAELADAVQEEARNRLGLDVAPDRLSYLHAGQVRQGNDTREEVILLGAPQPVVDEHVAILGDMGLRVQHIEAEPIALFRTFERRLRRTTDEQAVSVVADIGFRGTRILVARGRQIVFIKNIELGGQRFTEAVAKQLNVSLAEAADLRVRNAGEKAVTKPAGDGPAAATDAPAPGDSVTWSLYDAIRAEVDLLGKEIALCLRYCSVTFRGVRPASVILVGGEAHDPAVVSLLGEHLNMPCSVGEPLRGIDVSAVDLGGDRRANLAEWTLCAGLAMRDAQILAEDSEDENGKRDRLSA
jgi:type IV pilus assembly protein PilM